MKKLSAALLTIILLMTLAGCSTPPAPVTLPEPPVSEPEPPATTDNGLSDLIVLETPLPEGKIKSPLTIKGKARGKWFFEADFPVILTNWDGLIIAEGTAQAQDDWMTEDFVPFTAVIEFERPDTRVSNRGALILKKDNPSGLPENDDALEITVFYE